MLAPNSDTLETLRKMTANFLEAWHSFIENEDRVTNDPMEATYIGFKMWAAAVEKAGTTEVDKVRPAMYGLEALTVGT